MIMVMEYFEINDEETESKQALEQAYKNSPIRITLYPLKKIHKNKRPKNKAYAVTSIYFLGNISPKYPAGISNKKAKKTINPWMR